MIRGSEQGGVVGKIMTTRVRTRPFDSRNASSSERGAINGVTTGKDETVTATMPSGSKYVPPSRRFPAKQASQSPYIENPRQHMRTDKAGIKDVVFASLYPE